MKILSPWKMRKIRFLAYLKGIKEEDLLVFLEVESLHALGDEGRFDNAMKKLLQVEPLTPERFTQREIEKVLRILKWEIQP